jgi:hypothetical protein
LLHKLTFVFNVGYRMRKDPPKVNPARRHFFQMVGALAGAAVLTSSRQAQAQKSDGHVPVMERIPGNGHGGARCMLRGTRVLTARGAERVENLSIGDFVITSGGEAKPIKWIGNRRFSPGPTAQWPLSVHPVCVARSALADNVPHTNLYLSPMHALFIDGMLIPVKDLVNGTSIAYSLPEGTKDIVYFHIELEAHEVIFAEGACVETLLVSSQSDREHFNNFVEYEHRYGQDRGRVMPSCAPMIGYFGGRDHLKALLRLGVSRIVDVRDPIQVAYQRIAERANNLPLTAGG